MVNVNRSFRAYKDSMKKTMEESEFTSVSAKLFIKKLKGKKLPK